MCCVCVEERRGEERRTQEWRESLKIRLGHGIRRSSHSHSLPVQKGAEAHKLDSQSAVRTVGHFYSPHSSPPLLIITIQQHGISKDLLVSPGMR